MKEYILEIWVKSNNERLVKHSCPCHHQEDLLLRAAQLRAAGHYQGYEISRVVSVTIERNCLYQLSPPPSEK